MWKILFVLFAGSSIFGGQENKKPVQSVPAAPAEVKHTVEALKGTWTGQMTAKVPGYAPATFDWTMECKPVALGAGVACTNGGKASIGELSESCLFAFDPDGKAVHYMCVTSMGEVHDHKGHWLDSRIVEFEPLRAGMMGSQVIETLRWEFADVNRLNKSSRVTTPDGNEMIFEFRGKRQ